MSNKNTEVTLDNPLTGQTINVVYRSGIRLFQFMAENQLTDEDNARHLLNEAKSSIAASALSTLAGRKDVTAIDYRENVVLKGNTFRVRGKLITDLGEATEAHADLIREWRNKKALSSQKAIDKANAALESLTGSSITALQQKAA